MELSTKSWVISLDFSYIVYQKCKSLGTRMHQSVTNDLLRLIKHTQQIYLMSMYRDMSAVLLLILNGFQLLRTSHRLSSVNIIITIWITAQI